MKAKRVKNKDENRVLTRQDYDAVFEKKPKQVEQRQIRSFKFNNHRIKMNKVLFLEDKKRVVLPDGVSTLAHGNWRNLGNNGIILDKSFSLPRKGTLGRLIIERNRAEQIRKMRQK